MSVIVSEPVQRDENDTHQRNVDQLYQPPTGHKGISQVFDGLNHADQLKRKRSSVKIRYLCQTCLKYSTAFLHLLFCL